MQRDNALKLLRLICIVEICCNFECHNTAASIAKCFKGNNVDKYLILICI